MQVLLYYKMGTEHPIKRIRKVGCRQEVWLLVVNFNINSSNRLLLQVDRYKNQFYGKLRTLRQL